MWTAAAANTSTALVQREAHAQDYDAEARRRLWREGLKLTGIEIFA